MKSAVPPLRQGSPIKRAAIVRAALAVFVREGYARTSVDAIAAAAGVSKRTIYDYYGDKEQLFLSTLRETMDAQAAAFDELLDRTLGQVSSSGSGSGSGSGRTSGSTSGPASGPGSGRTSGSTSGPGSGRVDDLETALTRFGREFATAIARSEELAAVMRLMIAEAAHFPRLLEPTANRTVQQALADRLAELGQAGLLDVPDPMEAAEFLGLLVTGRVNYRSWYGAVPLDDAEIARLVDGGLRIFLRAYRPVGA